MASVEKLAIRGIRSFDATQLIVVEFCSPVTVIVGHNGSGKTTIIECLKYATTGDQPPNTRGGAFVHDPKIANDKEVKAQVKLRFRAANGQRMLAVRNLSVTTKKTGALTMKTLETILALDTEKPKGGAADEIEPSNKRAVISSRCAEIDTEIPNLLGVSKAVLDNVIFCHQEDSYWPLAEPSILKKKFDDIFEATKFTKALDSIKSLRKDRVAELKAEKERLEGLSREKAHADKLHDRISSLTSDIANKEIGYDAMREEYELLVIANQKFYDSATKFREIFMQVENLQEKKKHYQQELDDARENLQEMSDPDEVLLERVRNFDLHISQQKHKLKTEGTKLQDLEDDLSRSRKEYGEKLTEKGQYEAERKAHVQRVEDRETLIRELSNRFHMKGFDHTPLEREHVAEFITTFTDVRNQQNTATEDIQREYKLKSDDFNAKSRELHGELAGLKSQKETDKTRIANLNSAITKAEQDVDAAETLTSQLKLIETDIEEKEKRLQKIREEIKAANFDERITEKSTQMRSLSLKSADLEKEIQTLSLQADTRAKLELKREALRTKTSEVKTTLEINNPKFRRLVGSDANPETVEREVERALTDKEHEQGELQRSSESSGKDLAALEVAITNLKEQLAAKNQELQNLDREIRGGIRGFDTVVSAIDDAQRELDDRDRDLHLSEGSSEIWTDLLNQGKTKRKCPLCARDMNNRDLETYDKIVHEQLKKSTPAAITAIKQEKADWDEELKRLQKLGHRASERDKIKNVEVPYIEKQLEEKQSALPAATKRSHEALERLNNVKKELREIAGLKEHAVSVSRTHQEIQRLQREITSLENDLLSTGSTKTVDDVQSALEAARAESYALDREKQSITAEKDRQLMLLRSQENDLHALQLNLSEVKSQLRDKSALEKRIGEMQQEVTDVSAHLKALDAKIGNVESSVRRLELEYKQTESELNKKIIEAQRSSQELNQSVDKLESFNRPIERYVKEKRSRLLKEANAAIEQLQADMEELGQQIEKARSVVSGIEKEIHESGASMANLRENLRVRKLVKDIAATQAQIDTYDMEEAAKAKRIFQEKYQKEKDRETELQSKVRFQVLPALKMCLNFTPKFAHLGGELSSLREQLRTLEHDSNEFKDVGRRYRDQLIRVKMSDMANNDLEKYAKALDNAIMKYHSLKMEEVNDTMRHLWNKTYQGTDIDGIKICSDSEGGLTKRSYNYRVVMTKDQVEMDMRGRCSAGQKMLASIIIRLALADSFGQNCGILALDEPTNALDTENIDALASSLVE
ncbi:hypothetical protein EIP86_003722 [Pleurotus ostreatoroseus]|nr:hypothetical protein EIP86_003722 [Pleurotus ostreatoroseus]